MSRQPGRYDIKFTLPITVGTIAIVIFCIMTALYTFLKDEEHRKIISFSGTLLSAAAGITSAFYVGEALRNNVENQKIDRTLKYVERWNSSSMLKSREFVHKIDKILIENNSPTQVSSIVAESISTDAQLKSQVINILNTLEDISVAIEEDLVDKDLLLKFYKSIFNRYYEIFSTWISDLRTTKSNPRLFKSFTDFVTKECLNDQ